MSTLGEASQGNKENDLYFASTQMQGSYEDSSESRSRQTRMSQKILLLQVFNLVSDLSQIPCTITKKDSKT